MKTLSSPLFAITLAAGLAGFAGGPSSAQEEGSQKTPEQAAEQSGSGVVEQYCTNIRDAAADARLAWQSETLQDLEKQIEERIAELNAKQAEYESWLQRREEFLSKAGENVVAVYARMRPDAAAEQLAVIDDETAASVLANLVPRTASAILNEMQPARAAELALAMAGPPEQPKEEAAQ